MAQLPRGIAPDLLLSQVKNTAPYLFEEDLPPALRDFPPTQAVREFAADPQRTLTHFEYYRLCLSAHYLTCGTPVPTDVDNQIRLKLWPKQLPLEVALEMAQLVLESHAWDFTQVSARHTFGADGSPFSREPLSGHLGEWFTVSSAAYCALKQYVDPAAERKRSELLEEIAREVERHSEVFGSLWRAKEGVRALMASASIAHNFGDLDRVMDMWELAIEDPLRLRFYKLATTPYDPNRKLRYLGRLWVAGELYKSPIGGSAMALENHRHFALRKPRALRTRREFLIPTGPFFDDWGKRVAEGLRANDADEAGEDARSVFEALEHGWERLPKTVGYGRALRSFREFYPELSLDRWVKNHSARAVLETPRDRFEKKWGEEALRWMDEIPSRA